MKKTEKKIEIIDGEKIYFHISYELNNRILTAYIKVENEEVFRKFDNSSQILKVYFYNYLYQEIDQYFSLKVALIEENDEFHGSFEIQDLVKIPHHTSRKVQLKLSDEEVDVEIDIKEDFEICEEYENNPFNNSISSYNPLIEIYKNIVIIGKIKSEEDRAKLSTIYNSGEGAIYKCFDEFILETFGEGFKLKQIEQRTCSHFEVQIRYKIVPSIYID